MKRSGFFLTALSILFLASGFPSPGQAANEGCYIAGNGDYICENYGAAVAPATAAVPPPHTTP